MKKSFIPPTEDQISACFLNFKGAAFLKDNKEAAKDVDEWSSGRNCRPEAGPTAFKPWGSMFCKKDGYVLASSLLIVLILTILLGAAVMRSEMQFKEVIQKQDLQDAFYAAESGIDRAIFEMRRDPFWGLSGTGPYADVVLGSAADTIGKYSVEVADGGAWHSWETTRWIKAVGKNALETATRVIFARVIVENPSNFLVSTLGDLRIGSGATVDAPIFGRDIYFDVNDSLPDQDIWVNAKVFILRSIHGEDNPAVHFAPEASVELSPSITFAGIDLNRYRNLAMDLAPSKESYYSSGDLEVDLDDLAALNDGDLFRPKIIFAEGDVRISGKYDYSLLVIAQGDVYINSHIEPADGLEDPGVRPQIGLLASEDVIIPQDAEVGDDGNLKLEAFVMADGRDESSGVFLALGEKCSQGTLDFKGAITVRGGDEKTAVDLNVFAQRKYLFNAQLKNNNKIPFMPFIVNRIYWQEATETDPFPPLGSDPSN